MFVKTYLCVTFCTSWQNVIRTRLLKTYLNVTFCTFQQNVIKTCLLKLIYRNICCYICDISVKFKWVGNNFLIYLGVDASTRWLSAQEQKHIHICWLLMYYVLTICCKGSEPPSSHSDNSNGDDDTNFEILKLSEVLSAINVCRRYISARTCSEKFWIH